jgi:L-threonylcarbamoyladenylate synthase
MVEILTTDPIRPEAAVIQRGIDILLAGGVIAYQTETLYGLAADTGNTEAVERLFSIKGRDSHVPIPLIIGHQNALPRLVREIPSQAFALMNVFWPGPLTLIFYASGSVLTRLTADTGKIGIRLSSNTIARSLAAGLRRAITATSANLSGEGGISSAREVVRALGSRIDAIIDGGKTPGGPGSTVLDVTCDPPVILREGIIPASAIVSACSSLSGTNTTTI